MTSLFATKHLDRVHGSRLEVTENAVFREVRQQSLLHSWQDYFCIAEHSEAALILGIDSSFTTQIKPFLRSSSFSTARPVCTNRRRYRPKSPPYPQLCAILTIQCYYAR